MGIEGLSPALQAGFLGMQRASARLEAAADAVGSGAAMEGLIMANGAEVEVGAAVTRSAEERLQTLVDLLT